MPTSQLRLFFTSVNRTDSILYELNRFDLVHTEICADNFDLRICEHIDHILYTFTLKTVPILPLSSTPRPSLLSRLATIWSTSVRVRTGSRRWKHPLTGAYRCWPSAATGVDTTRYLAEPGHTTKYVASCRRRNIEVSS